MISVSEAKHLISSALQLNPPALTPLAEAAGSVLAEEVFAGQDIPGFDQSAMDGYAIRFDEKNNPLSVQDEIPAGDGREKKLNRKHAARIFTGAPVPDGADTVVMQEKAEYENGYIIINDEQLEKGKNIRKRGSEIRAGDPALRAGTLLSPGAIGFLAGIGIPALKIHRSPSVSIIVTGNELVTPGKPVGHGQVYESNSFALVSSLQQAGVKNIQTGIAPDDASVLMNMLRDALKSSDMILLTGGVSVGKYDLVPGVAKECGVETIFHKVKQKPGKPIFFGMFGRKPVFGLPGNPSSVLTCFYEYVLPAIETITGKNNLLKVAEATAAGSYQKPRGLTHFLKGYYQDGKVKLLGAQESYRMSSFATANCFVFIPEDNTVVENGDTVEIHLFPL